jgi:predicted RNase H-like nuclease (RuvC/YqgF family)
MEGHDRTRELKQKILDDCAILHPRHECANAEERREEYPETSLIRQLREKGTKWEIIANILNQMRDKNDMTEAWTPTQVYSRFMSSTTATASTAKEIGFDTKDYVYLHDPGDAERSQAGRKRVRNCANATELAANVRSPGEVNEQREELQTSEMTTQLVAAVAVVDRNFWTLVADELERRTARYYAPEELALRFHKV